jgi:hypothetical protein
VNSAVVTERFHLHQIQSIPIDTADEILSVAYDDEFVYSGTADGVIHVVDKKVRSQKILLKIVSQYGSKSLQALATVLRYNLQ